MKTYLLFVFAKSPSQEKMVKFIAEELSGGIDSGDIRYFYGPEAIIFTFKTNEHSEDVEEYVRYLFLKSEIIYFLIPYNSKKISFYLSDEITEHLFGTDILSDKTEIPNFDSFKNENPFYNDNFDDMMDIDDFDEEEEDLVNFFMNTEDTLITLDDVLDKINKTGIKSLNQKEINILNKYSK